MLNLLRTEWLKLRKYWAFWCMIGITALSYPGINFIFQQVYREAISRPGESGQVFKMLMGNPFTFPEVWHTLAYASSIFVFIPAVLVIMFITNEYSFKTQKQNIIDGWSRSQFMSAKLLDVLLVSLTITLLYVIVTLIIGFSNPNPSLLAKKWSLLYYIGLFALQTFSQLSIAFLIGFLIKKAFIALGVFIFYFFPLEPFLVAILKEKLKNPHDIGRYLPLEISDRIIPYPAFIGKFDQVSYQHRLDNINIHILYTVLLTGFIWFICYRVNSRRDL